MVTWKDHINKDWNYSISANGGINHNLVQQVATGGNPIYAFLGANVVTRTMVGQPIGEFYGREVVGIFQSAADVLGYTNKDGIVIQPTAKPGDFKYKDENGDGVIDDKDRVVLGNPNPKFVYGLNTTLSYKQFDLLLDFQGVSGVSIYNAVKITRRIFITIAGMEKELPMCILQSTLRVITVSPIPSL
mgnify:CR=1 FL=1